MKKTNNIKKAKTQVVHDYFGNAHILVKGSRKEFDKNFEIIKVYTTNGVSHEMVVSKQK